MELVKLADVIHVSPWQIISVVKTSNGVIVKMTNGVEYISSESYEETCDSINRAMP